MKTVTSEQMHNIDAQATQIYGIPSIILMENAARGAFEIISKEIDKNRTITIICGNGNNGGDGFAIARLLFIEGYSVDLIFLGREEKLTQDARTNYEICQKLGISFTEEICGSVIIDCIFGTGLKRAVEGKYAEMIEKINNSIAYVYSIDISSGLSSDTGEVLGVAVKANKTLTFQLGKIGLYINDGPKYSGEIEVVDIFIPKELLK